MHQRVLQERKEDRGKLCLPMMAGVGGERWEVLIDVRGREGQFLLSEVLEGIEIITGKLWGARGRG
jgi:hypothetical protein